MLKGLEKWTLHLECEKCKHHNQITNITDKDIKWVLKVLKPK